MLQVSSKKDGVLKKNLLNIEVFRVDNGSRAVLLLVVAKLRGYFKLNQKSELIKKAMLLRY